MSAFVATIGRLRAPRLPPARDARARRMTIRVLVVDDQAMVRAGFRLLLADEPDIEVVAEAGNGLEAVAEAARCHPHVVLMDIRMPELDGLEATRRILAADPSSRILILTTFDLDEYVYRALQAGASGFVLKDDPPEQLIAAVRTVAGGDALLSPSVTRRVIQQFTRVHQQAPPKAVETLTAARDGRVPPDHPGYSNAEIGRELFISDTTVKTHVTRLLQKLDLRDRAQAIVLAYQTGLFDTSGLDGVDRRSRPTSSTRASADRRAASPPFGGPAMGPWWPQDATSRRRGDPSPFLASRHDIPTARPHDRVDRRDLAVDDTAPAPPTSRHTTQGPAAHDHHRLTDQEVRRHHRRPRHHLHRPRRPGHRLPRPERRRQVHVHADDGRPHDAHRGDRDHLRPALRRPAQPRARGRRDARRLRPARRPHRPRDPDHRPADHGRPGLPGRRAARAGQPHRRPRRTGGWATTRSGCASASASPPP